MIILPEKIKHHSNLNKSQLNKTHFKFKNTMPNNSPSTILELRTGRDSELTPEAAVQLFSTLPKLKNTLWDRLFKTHESLSFEILVQNQTIYFLCHCPNRVVDYLKSALTASYPQLLITKIQGDPVLNFLPEFQSQFEIHQQSSSLSMGKLVLNQSELYSLKTYHDFAEVDPLSSMLSVLSHAQPLDLILVQIIVSPDSDNWKKPGWKTINYRQPSDATESTESSSSNLEPIKKKLNLMALKTSIKVAALTENQDRSNNLLEQIASSLNAVTQSQSNSLKLKKIHLFKSHFLETIVNRSFCRNPNIHLSVEELATIFHLPSLKLSSIPNIAWGKRMVGEAPDNLPIITKNTDKTSKDKINVFAETTFKNQTVKYGLKQADRRRHFYVIGKTGTGKSTMLANMAINDLKNNEGMAVIDPHGDLIEIILDFIPSHRINDVIYFNPADTSDRIVKMNLFEGENVVHRELIASGIISIFHKLYGYSWGPRLEYILRNALLTLLSTPQSNLSDVIRLLVDAKFRQNIVAKLEDPILKDYWLKEYNQQTDRLRTESISSILNKIGQFVSSPLIRNVVDARKSSFSIENAMDEGKILLANLSQGKLGEDNATLLGAMLITKIQLAAMSRVHIDEEERRDFYLYVDEFQNFATESFVKILSEARKYRLNLTLANQYVAQIPEEVQKAIFGNCGSIASFVMGADDADLFNKEYGHLYTQDDLVNLSRHQIINKISIDNIISRPFPAQTLPPLSNKNSNREKVINVSRERYAG